MMLATLFHPQLNDDTPQTQTTKEREQWLK